MSVLSQGVQGAADGPEPARPAARPTVAELRLSAFKSLRGAAFPLGPVTLLSGASGSGKTTVLQAYEALARLGSGSTLEEVFPDPAACVPESARPDRQRRRGFRIGCTVDGPAGPVRLDLAVQAEPELRIVGERLTADGTVLLESALRDPARRTVQAAWHTAGTAPVTRAPLPDDRLGTALVPLRVAGKTDGQRRVIAAAEQVVVALRSAFGCDPRPAGMRAPARIGDGRLRRGCDNLAEVLRRTHTECGIRHAALVSAVREGCAGPVADLLPQVLEDGRVRAVIERGGAGGVGGAGGASGTRGTRNGAAGTGTGAGAGAAADAGNASTGTSTGTPTGTPVERLGDGELRYLALALVLLTGPGVLAVDPVAEVPDAYQTLTVLADGFVRSLDPAQARQLAALAVRMAARGHLRLVGTVSDASWARGLTGLDVVDLDRVGAAARETDV